jgi:hypothetical protein
MLSGEIYNPYKVGDDTWEKNPVALEKFNFMSYKQEKERMQILRNIFGNSEDNAVIVAPFYCDKGE